MTTLADVGRSAGAALGVAGFTDALGLGTCRHVVVCLIDGLGWNALRASASHAPALISMAGGPIDAPFPTTTSVGLAALGTGLATGTHGLVGAAFLLPETGALLVPLHWGSTPTPVAVQPEPTIFETLERAGVAVTTAAPAAYQASGLTRAVLRGGSYSAAEDVASRVAAVVVATASLQRTFTYVYWPELDRVGHEHGVASGAWRAALSRADALVARLAESLPADTALVVTADHGMVDCADDDRLVVEDHPALMRDVTRVAGEPRARHLYVRAGAAPDVRAAWQEVLGPRAVVSSRSELVEGGWFGDVDPALVDRIGDVMAVATGTSMLASRVDARVSSLRGQHGAPTDDERLIPALIARTA